MDKPAQKGFSQSTLKFLTRHMAEAAGRQKQREGKISGFESQIEMLRKSARAPRPSRQKLETGLDRLSRRIKDVINEERVLVVNQEKEERVLEELKERLDLLEEKFYSMGHVHSMAAHDHMKRIEDINKKINELSTGIKEDKTEGKKRVKHLPELVIKTMKDLGKKKKLKEIKKLEAMIKKAEKTHAKLKKKKIPKKHLDALKRTIDSHKKRLKKMKK